jgi:hypothetical protein
MEALRMQGLLAMKSGMSWEWSTEYGSLLQPERLLLGNGFPVCGYAARPKVESWQET